MSSISVEQIMLAKSVGLEPHVIRQPSVSRQKGGPVRRATTVDDVYIPKIALDNLDQKYLARRPKHIVALLARQERLLSIGDCDLERMCPEELKTTSMTREELDKVESYLKEEKKRYASDLRRLKMNLVPRSAISPLATVAAPFVIPVIVIDD